jgi:hypothetical protein
MPNCTKTGPKIAYHKKRFQQHAETVDKNAWLVPKAGFASYQMKSVSY